MVYVSDSVKIGLCVRGIKSTILETVAGWGYKNIPTVICVLDLLIGFAKISGQCIRGLSYFSLGSYLLPICPMIYTKICPKQAELLTIRGQFANLKRLIVSIQQKRT